MVCACIVSTNERAHREAGDWLVPEAEREVSLVHWTTSSLARPNPTVKQLGQRTQTSITPGNRNTRSLVITSPRHGLRASCCHPNQVIIVTPSSACCCGDAVIVAVDVTGVRVVVATAKISHDVPADGVSKPKQLIGQI